MSSALDRLLEKTLPEDEFSGIKKKKLTTAQRKARRTQAQAQLKLKQSLDPKLERSKRVLQRMKNLANLEKGNVENEELDELKKLILEKKEAMRPVKVGRRSRVKKDIVVEETDKKDSDKKMWEGLTPGLAPVGYEPDEDVSDSD